MPEALRPVRFPAQRMTSRTEAGGTRVFRSPLSLEPLPRNANVALERGAAAHPQRAFLVARDAADGWTALRYGDALRRVRAIAAGLLELGATPERPLLVVAPNGIASGLVTLAALHVGIPIAPIPPEYARAGVDPARLARLAAAVHPALAYVDASLAECDFGLTGAGLTRVADIATLERGATGAVETAARSVTLDTVAKILFTSGSTGEPKGVITTHRMIVANQVAFAQIWPPGDEPPVIVDWLPWSHSFGGNKVFNLALHRGGTLYVDEGRPTAAGFARTLRNLREIAPSMYFGVPRSFALLVPALANDEALRERFFSNLDFAFSAAAALPQPLVAAFASVARAATPRIVPLFGGWGATETAPGATCEHEVAARGASLGVPLPGVEIALVPVAGGRELRVRGPNVTPGYWRDAGATGAAFDASGFYRSGDAGTLVDEGVPDAGFAFAGRLAEHFKLSSGSWVVASALRSAFLEAASPLAFDAVITGADRDDVGALVYLDLAATRAFAGSPSLDCAVLAADPSVRRHIARALRSVNAGRRDRAERLARAAIVGEAPLSTTGELTAKGTIARAAALRLRANAIAAMHDDAVAGERITPDL